jgi:iron complex transport system permease protein
MTTAALGGWVWRTPAVSLRVHPRAVAVLAVLLLLLLGASIWSIAAGDFPLSPLDVLRALVGQGEGPTNFIVFGLRLPRLLTGLCAGMSFGVAGAIFQSLARNPLASPDVIGFDSGAALGAVTAVILFGASGLLVAVGAIGGGLATGALVALLSWQRGIAPVRLVLVGLGVGAFAYAGVDFLMTRSDIFEAAAAQSWLTGSLNARVWSHAWTAGIGVAVLIPAALLLQPSLDRIELGDSLAASLGIAVDRQRIFAGIVGLLLAALAVASAGPLPFVALVAAPIARRVIGSGGPALLTSAVVGALVVTAGDLTGRLLFAPTQLPAGVFTAVFGAPYLLWLLGTQIRRGAL